MFDFNKHRVNPLDAFERKDGYIIGYTCQRSVYGDQFMPWADGPLGVGVYFGNTPLSVAAYNVPHRLGSLLGLPEPPGESAHLKIPVPDNDDAILQVPNFNALTPITRRQQERLAETLTGIELVVGRAALGERIGNAIGALNRAELTAQSMHGYLKTTEPVEILTVMPAEVLTATSTVR